MISLIILVILILILAALWNKIPAVQARVNRRRQAREIRVNQQSTENRQVAEGYSWIINKQGEKQSLK